jgi:TPP-dependent pyruvate/acetoin dehydrogenase alpha subunit
MDSRCPIGAKNYPTTPCSEGKKAVDLAKKGKVGGCPYFINDAESCFCFFKFGTDDGRIIPTHRIARMLMMDDLEVKRIIQSFRRKIISLLDK